MTNAAHDNHNSPSDARPDPNTEARRRAARKSTNSDEKSTNAHCSTELSQRTTQRFMNNWFWFCALVLVLAGFSYFPLGTRRSTLRTEESGLQNGASFEVASIPGKGMGVMATKTISAGETLFREGPLFIVPSTTSGSPEDLIHHRIHGLTEAQRSTFFNLSYVVPGVDISTFRLSERQIALAIFQTNAIAAGDGVGIFPTVARLNHGCSAAFNAVYSWREREGFLVVHALKPIQRGEEILTTYTNTRRRRAERRSYLKDNYDFVCTCAVCSLPDEESRVSDERLVKMTSLYTKLATWSSGGIDGPAAVKNSREIWAIGDVEGYVSERGQLAADVVHVACAHSDVNAASSWAKLAVDWFTRELGADSDQVRTMKKYLKDPRSHPAWASRRVMRIE